MCSRAFQLLIQFLQVWIGERWSVGGEECRRGKGEGVWEEWERGRVGEGECRRREGGGV